MKRYHRFSESFDLEEELFSELKDGRLVALGIHLTSNKGYEVEEAIGKVADFDPNDTSFMEVDGVEYRVLTEEEAKDIFNEEFSNFLEEISYDYNAFTKNFQITIFEKCLDEERLYNTVYDEISGLFNDEEEDADFNKQVLEELEEIERDGYRGLVDFVRDELSWDNKDMSQFINWDKVEEEVIALDGYVSLLGDSTDAKETGISVQKTGTFYYIFERED